jgi:hypothetical protein
LPLFKRAADVLGAQLVKVDEGFDPASDATPAPASAWPVASVDSPEPEEG